MSLRVWLPLNGTLDNQGLDQVSVINNGATVDNNGKIGKCYSFDGSDDYISLNSSLLYSIIQGGATPFSIAMWVYHADATRAILFGDYGLSNAIGFNIELTTSHTVRFYWNGTPDKNTSSTIMDLNTWVHLTIVYDGTQILFYKNGTKTSDVYTGTLATKTKTAGYYYLGRDSRTGTTALNGKLNDVRIYDHALSPMEVKQISQGLILHYLLNDNGFNNNIEYDCSGYKRNGEKVNINYSSDTPKYDVSSVFLVSPSVIKIPNQNYAIQGSQNMTISVWVYKEDWSQYSQRIYSCTEDGGLNIQPTSSGQIEWAVNVYTNVGKTSHKYATSNPDLYIRIPKTDFSSGWHMFTWVYTTEGTSLYIDGILEKTMTGTSYGLYFNSTAPLILGGEATANGYTSPYLNGKLSDFRIYCTALSTEDILALYKKSTYIDNEGNLYGAELREV